jgi:hypothetical protein
MAGEARLIAAEAASGGAAGGARGNAAAAALAPPQHQRAVGVGPRQWRYEKVGILHRFSGGVLRSWREGVFALVAGRATLLAFRSSDDFRAFAVRPSEASSLVLSRIDLRASTLQVAVGVSAEYQCFDLHADERVADIDGVDRGRVARRRIVLGVPKKGDYAEWLTLLLRAGAAFVWRGDEAIELRIAREALGLPAAAAAAAADGGGGGGGGGGGDGEGAAAMSRRMFGYLWKCGESNNRFKRRYFRVYADSAAIAYHIDVSESEERGRIVLRGAKLLDAEAGDGGAKHPLEFRVATLAGRTYVLRAESLDELRMWREALAAALLRAA